MMDLPWVAMALVGAGLVGVLGLAELSHRVLGVGAEQSRKLAHAAAGPILIGLPTFFDSAWPVLLLSLGFEIVLVATRLTGQLQSVHGIRRTSVGAFLYPVAISMTFVLAAGRPERYAVAIAALAFADAASGFVGQRWGRVEYAAWGEPKSLEGSIAAFAVTAVTTGTILLLAGTAGPVALLVAVVTGLVIAFVEAALPWGLDNVGVPLAGLVALDLAGSAISIGLVLLAAGLLLVVAVTHGRPTGRPAVVPSAGTARLGR